MLASWAVPKGVPLEAGAQGARGARRGPSARVRAASTGEIPAGQYGGGTVEIWDSGTYELLEEKPDGGLKVRLHGRAAAGGLDARAGASRRQGGQLAADPQPRAEADPRPRPAGDTTSRCSRRLPAELPPAGELALRGEVRRLPRARLRARRRLHAPLAQRQRPQPALRGRRGGGRARRSAATRCSTARSARSTSAGRPSFSAMQQGSGRARLLRLRLPRGRRRVARRAAARGAPRAPGRGARPPERDACCSPRPSTTARRCSPPPSAQGLEGVVAKRARLDATPQGRTNARLAEDQDARPARSSSIAGYTRGQRRPCRHASARSSSPSTRAASSATSATSAPASTTREIRRLLGAARAARARELAVSRPRRSCRACGGPR